MTRTTLTDLRAMIVAAQELADRRLAPLGDEAPEVMALLTCAAFDLDTGAGSDDAALVTGAILAGTPQAVDAMLAVLRERGRIA